MNSFQYQGHTLTWDEHSTGEQTFIFIHGYSAPRQSWEPLLHYFIPLGRCVTLDLPGHGLAKTPADYNHLPQEFFIDLETEAVRTISNGGPVTLIGHSTGGLIALSVAARLPGVVKRVISLDGVVWGPLTGLLGFAHWLLGHHLYPAFWALWAFTQISSRAMMFGIGFYVHDQQAHWKNQLAWEACRSTHPIYVKQDLKNLAILLNFLETCDIRPLIRSLDIPVLAITGDKDPVVPPVEAHWLAENLPNAQLQVFPGLGHIPNWEAEPDCHAAMLAWLAKNPIS